MKFKPTHKPGGLTVELGPHDQDIPVPGFATLPEFKLKRIVVPMDFSTCASKALEYAVAFAKQFGAELHLVYVEQAYYTVPELGAVNATKIEADQVEAARVRLEAIVETELRKRVTAEAHVCTGHPPHEITRFARELAADLIIISTHGRTGLKHVLLGSTAESVVRYAPCPVLVVREDEHEFISAQKP